MHRSSAVGDHRHVGIEDGEALRAAGGDERLAGGGHQHALAAERDHVGPELHRIAIGYGDGPYALRMQPMQELGLHRLGADHGKPFGEHAHLHVQVQEMRVESVNMHLPALRLEPAPQLLYRGLDGTFAGIAADRHARLQHHEIPALDVARRDEVVDRNAGIEIEAQAGRVLAAAIGLLHLHDDGAPRGHDAAVPREDLVRQAGLGRQHVYGHARLRIGILHLPVLGARDFVIEAQAGALCPLGHRIAGLPLEMIDGPDQHVAQGAVFAVHAPALGTRSVAPVHTSSQMRHGPSPAIDSPR